MNMTMVIFKDKLKWREARADLDMAQLRGVTSYWASNSDQRTLLVKIIEGAIESVDDEELQNEMDAFLVFLSPHASS